MTSFDDLGGVLVGVRGMTWGIRATRASVHRIVEVQQAPVCFVLCAATFHGVDSSMDQIDRTLRTGGRGERRAFTVGARGAPDFRCACVGTRLSVSSSSRGCCESTVVLGGFTHRRTGPPYLTQNSDLRVEVPNTLLYSSSRGAVLRGDAFSSVRRLPFPL